MEDLTNSRGSKTELNDSDIDSDYQNNNGNVNHGSVLSVVLAFINISLIFGTTIFDPGINLLSRNAISIDLFSYLIYAYDDLMIDSITDGMLSIPFSCFFIYICFVCILDGYPNNLTLFVFVGHPHIFVVCCLLYGCACVACAPVIAANNDGVMVYVICLCALACVATNLLAYVAVFTFGSCVDQNTISIITCVVCSKTEKILVCCLVYFYVCKKKHRVMANNINNTCDRSPLWRNTAKTPIAIFCFLFGLCVFYHCFYVCLHIFLSSQKNV